MSRFARFAPDRKPDYPWQLCGADEAIDNRRELTAHPNVLFLDEPTSVWMRVLRNLLWMVLARIANAGRKVVYTIYQPSTGVFNVFDNLLLIKSGGKTVFAGELGKNASAVIAYSKSIVGTAKLEDNHNPATWMLEVIDAGVGNNNGEKTDFMRVFQLSKNNEVVVVKFKM